MKNLGFKKIMLCGMAALLAMSFFFIIASRKNPPRPNIIFITLDSLRADHLGCYGYPRNTSPNIDALAREGILFEQAIAQASWTAASNASILTSLYPRHELIEHEGYILSPKDNNLARILQKAGYTTALFTNATPTLDVAFRHIKKDFNIFNAVDAGADKIITAAIDFLQKPSRKPIFMWVYLYDTHWPYIKDRAYYSNFLSDQLHPQHHVPIAPHGRHMNDHYSVGFIPRHAAEDGIEDTSYYIAKYDGGIKFSDQQVGLLVSFLRQPSQKTNNIIVLFADHGESMTEHNFYFNHSHYLYDNLIRVPLIISDPKQKTPQKISVPTSLINIMPTILDLSRIPAPNNIEGKSLLRLLQKPADFQKTEIFSETPFFPSPRSIRSNGWKLIHNRATEHYELYNLNNDPQELRNVFGENRAIASSLKQRLERWAQTARTHTLDKNAKTSDEEKKKLRALGYLQ